MPAGRMSWPVKVKLPTPSRTCGPAQGPAYTCYRQSRSISS